MTAISAPDEALLTAAPILPLKGKFISIAPRVALYSGQVDGAPTQDSVTRGVVAFLAKNTTGDYSDAQPGMTIDLGSVANSAQYAARVRTGVTVAGEVRVAETAFSLFPVADDMHFTVRDEWRPWLVKPRGIEIFNGTPYVNDFDLFMDYNRPYFDANDVFTPKANITRSSTSRLSVKPAGFVDGWWGETTLKTYRTVVLSSAFSLTLTTGGSISGRLWDVGDGTIVSGSSTTETITVRFPVGFRYITLRVEDNTANHYGFMRYPIWVHDATNLPLTRFNVTRNSTSNWREMEFQWFEQTTDTTILPKGSAVCYWEMPDLPGIPAAIPEQYRDQFLGWTREDVTPFKRYRRLMKMTVVGIGGWYSGWRGFPVRIFDPSRAPADWTEMEDITMDRLVYYVLNNFTTVMGIANWYPSPLTHILKALDITLGNPFAQINYIVSGYYGHVKCDSLNGMWTRRDFQYKTDAEKSSTDTIMHLNRAHWRWDNPPEFPRRYYNSVGYVLGTGSSWDGAAEIPARHAADAPGLAQDDGEGDQQAPFQNLPSTGAQEELERLTGVHLAVLNNAWTSIPLELLYDLDIFEPAWAEPLSITTDDADSGLELDHEPFIVKEVNINYNKPGQGREKVITLSLEGVVSGTGAEYKDVPPDETFPDDSDPIPPPIEIPPYFPPLVYPEYEGDEEPTELIVFDSGGPNCHVALSINTVTGAVTYQDVSDGLTGYNVWATADPWLYNRYFALQSTGLYKNEDPFGGASWTLVADNDTLFGDSSRLGSDIFMSINRRGWIGISCGHNLVTSADYGATWTGYKVRPDLTLEDGWATTLSINSMKFAVSPFNNPGEAGQGWMYAGVGQFGFGYYLYFSDDWGATWTLKSNPDTLSASPHPHVPYVRTDGSTLNINDDAQEVFAQGWGGSNNARLWLITAKGASPALYHNVGAANIQAPASVFAGRPMSTFTWDGRKYATALSHSGAGGGTGIIHFDDSANKIVDLLLSPGGTEWNNTGWTNRYSNHSGAILFGGRIYLNLVTTMDEGATLVYTALPSGYTGSSYAEWSLRNIVIVGE